ncbi:uncharacterized protein [Mytilus edulis]|uniref:uncharacterized protein n=1 Tax=Mytilus edulis TaxID=6550 RepID=UPI0039F01194
MSNVKVAVRVRPINKRELDQNGKSIVDTNGDAISVTNIKVDSNAEYGDSRERIKTFTFDYCYDSTGEPHSPQYAPQQLVFQDLGTEVLQAAFEGYNACVLAYGQTSTGKTYTMTGIREDPGLIPRICEGLFSHVDDFEASDRTTFRINISYLEIYNERVRDLLRPSLSQRNEKYTLKVREHPKEGPYVQDLSSHFVKDNEQIQTLLDKGNESRTTASTYMHDHSSRSHAIVTINFIQAKLDDDLPHEIVSKIHLVDLAGSERADPNWSLNYKGRLKEGSNINKSLVTLGNVIKTLAEKSILSWSTDSLGSTQSFASSGGGEGRASPFCSPKRMRLPYIPYRDSVLTWLLKDSLGGNSKTIMIATISPASICYNETISTLRYAQRAKNIVNKPKINEDASVTLIRELRSEIDRLKNMLSTSQMGFYPTSDVMYVVPFQKLHREGESMLPIQDSGQALEQQLQLQEDRANKLTQTWMDKWMEAHEIIKESDLSIRGLNKASSMGVLIDSQMPHLIGMDSDILSTGVIIYHLKEGKTLVGKEDAKREQDIVLNGPGIQREHCLIKNIDGSVTLYPNRGSHCTVNGLDCKAPVLLKQGDSVILGKSQMFRFNNPAEAAVLRERRASQECLLDEPTSPSFMETDQHRTVTASRTHCLYASTEFCLQLENQYQSETEKIERAKEELERLKQEHLQAEEQRQLKEEELWNTHNLHLHEIEEERKRLTKLKEETFIQRQKADQELQYSRECLEKEREAFYQELQNELSKIRSSKSKSTDDDSVFPEDIDPSEVYIDIIRRRKLSVEGQLKTIVQKEILRTFSHQETEKSLRKKTDDLEDEFELSKNQIENQLVKIKEIEEQYRQRDAKQYTEINNTELELDEIQEREEQLELYIEEKQDLLNVKSDKPRPLRTACSVEVLTNLPVETEFGQKTSSMLALNRGSAGDLPAISHQFSLSSMMSVDSESTESDLTSSSSDNKSKLNSGAKKKISTGAKSVTDRLYQKSTPKFKYEPKTKKTSPPAADKKTRGRKGLQSDSGSFHRLHDNNGTIKNSTPEKRRRTSPSKTDGAHDASQSCENQTLSRSASKRHMKSSTSLASVPEAVGEEGDDQIMHSTPDISQVVRRRNKGNRSNVFDDDFRRHSEPAGEELADAFEKYSQEMEKSGGVDNSNYRHSVSQDESVSNRNSVDIPSVIVSDDTDNITFLSRGVISAQGQECQVSMAVCEGGKSEVATEDIEGQQEFYVAMEDHAGFMECQSDSTSQESYNVIKPDVKHEKEVKVNDNNTNIDEVVNRSADFTVDLMPIIDVSYCEGEPFIPKSHDKSQKTLSSGEDRSDICENDLYLTQNAECVEQGHSENMIRIGSKREHKSQPTSTVPSKLRKSGQNNYQWLVNAISSLSEEKLLDLDYGEDNENSEETDKIDNEYHGNDSEFETEESCDEQDNGQSWGRKAPTGEILVNKNEEIDNIDSNVSRSDQDCLDDNKEYYSDSLDDEDSLDGSRPSGDQEEPMSDSLNGSGGEGSENNGETNEYSIDNPENGVTEYFSDIEPDLKNVLQDEEMVQDLSDYDEVADDDDDDMMEERAQIYIQYPMDFPGSLLYSIKEESVPASPDLSESKDFSSELSYDGDQTLEDDKYLSQVFVLGQENQATVVRTEGDAEESVSEIPQDKVQHNENIICEDSKDLQNLPTVSNEMCVRSETQIVLTAEMDKIEESPIVYHPIESVQGDQGKVKLVMSAKSVQISGMDTSELKSEDQQGTCSLVQETTKDYDSNLELCCVSAQSIGELDSEQSEQNGFDDEQNEQEGEFNVQSEHECFDGKQSEQGGKFSMEETDIVSEQCKVCNITDSEQTDINDISDTTIECQSASKSVTPDNSNSFFSNCTCAMHQAANAKNNTSKITKNKILDKSKPCKSETNELPLDQEEIHDQNNENQINTQLLDATNLSVSEEVDMDTSDTISLNEEIKSVGAESQNEFEKVPPKCSEDNSVNPNELIKVKPRKSRPETRTLGVSTSPDLVTVGCGDDIASDDSLQEVQEELLVLQEALDNKSPKYTNTNGSSLSSARKATRKRAMQKRGSGICTESEDLMSSDSPESQSKSSSSRPDSASRRRRRPNTKSADRSGKKSKGLSSDEYITSENDSVYSDESPSRKSRDGKKNQEEIPVDIAKTLNSCIDELTDSITQNDGLEDIDMDQNIPNGYSAGDSEQEQYGTRQKNRHVNGNYIPSLQLRNLSQSEEQSCEYNGQDQLEDARQMSWRSSVSSGGQSSRSTSETRDASMQTDSPFMSLPIRSPMSTQTESGSRHSLSASPISVWNSVDKCIKSPKGHVDGGKEKSPGGKKMVKTKQCKLSDLSHTTPDTWSADITDVPPNFDTNVDLESGSESDGDAVIVETESCSPATPSTSDHFFESGYMVLQEPPSGRHIPVKYEVTLKPEETNIHYNVEKTEYKTYGLHSPGRETENIPESININITDRTSNISENRYETITRQQLQINQATDETPSGNIISERTFRASSELSSDRSDSNLEIRSERLNVEEDEQHFVETTVQNFPIDNDRLIGKEEDMFSPRESDTTSDYGTMIYDRRRGVSAAYDSDDIDSLASYGKYFTGSQENTPRGNITKLESDRTESAAFHDDENEPQNLEQTLDMTPRTFTSEEQKLPVESINTSRDTSRSSEDVYVTAEMSRTSSMSSEYKTPQQSPREGGVMDDLSCENIQIPDISDSSKALISEKLKEIKMQKTVSVNTEQLKEREQVIRETLKNELQKKIEDLKYSRKSKDDSAISSDFTDGDSVSVSPRGSQLSEKLLGVGNIGPDLVEVRTTETETSFEPSSGAQSYLPKLVDIDNKSVQKIPQKDSGNVFDDEDMEELMSQTTEYLSNVQNHNNGAISDSDTIGGQEHHSPACIENKMFVEKESSDRSLSPGEVVADDMYEQFASGLNSGSGGEMESEYFSNENDNTDGHQEDSRSSIEMGINSMPERRNSAELLEMMDSKNLNLEKCSSLSNIRKDVDVSDFRRSVSENCMDQYEEAASLHSSSSNDSIVFVFMGQSHTRESMEQLKHYTSKQEGYKVHESNDNILSQNHGNGETHSYKDSDYKDSDGSMDSQEEMITNMEHILSQNDLDSPEFSEETGIDSQEISEETGLESQEISEEQYLDSQDISENIDSMGDNQSDPLNSGETSPLTTEIVEEIVTYDVNPTETAYYENKRVTSRQEEDEEPLRHKFGIDESILPIPTRSVSSDNLPRKISNQRKMHRSRSTSLLDMEKPEKITTSSDNEGIFPPNVQHSESNSIELEQKEDKEYIGDIEADLEGEDVGTGSPDMPPTPAPSVVDDTEEDKQTSHALNQDVLYSSLFPLQTQQSLLDHNGNIEDISDAQGGTPERSSQLISPSRFVSVGTQAALADSETQTDASVFISPDGKIVQVLPGLDSPLRSQSMVTLQGRMTQFNPSEDSENWYNLSSLMLETIPLLRNINQRLPGADISQASSVENFAATETSSLSTQTTGSLENLNNTDVDTDKRSDTKMVESTQTEYNLTHSFTETNDLPPDNLEKSEISVQTDEPEVRKTESNEISVQTDFVWSMASSQPITTTTASLNYAWNNQQLENESATGSLFSVDRTNMQTGTVLKSLVETSTTEAKPQHMTTSEKHVTSDGEDSSEEVYTENCVMFYDFVNKCYVQNVESSEWHRLEKNRKKNEKETIATNTSHHSEGIVDARKHDTVESHTTVKNDNTDIDRGVRIHPRYSGYSYKTSPKQTDSKEEQDVKSEESKSSYSSVQQNNASSYRNRYNRDSTNRYDFTASRKQENERNISPTYRSYEEERRLKDLRLSETKTKSDKPQYLQEENKEERPESPEEVITVEEIIIVDTQPSDSEEGQQLTSSEKAHRDTLTLKIEPQKSDSQSADLESPQETITEEIVTITDYMPWETTPLKTYSKTTQQLEKEIVESPEEAKSEEIVTITDYMPWETTPSGKERLTPLNTDPKTTTQHMEKEVVGSPEETKSEEIVIETTIMPWELREETNIPSYTSHGKENLTSLKIEPRKTTQEHIEEETVESPQEWVTEEVVIISDPEPSKLDRKSDSVSTTESSRWDRKSDSVSTTESSRWDRKSVNESTTEPSRWDRKPVSVSTNVVTKLDRKSDTVSTTETSKWDRKPVIESTTESSRWDRKQDTVSTNEPSTQERKQDTYSSYISQRDRTRDTLSWKTRPTKTNQRAVDEEKIESPREVLTEEFVTITQTEPSEWKVKEENGIPSSRLQKETLQRELQSLKIEPRTFKRHHLDEEIIIDRESPQEEVTEEVSTSVLIDRKLHQPSLSETFKFERKAPIERYVDNENIVEDIVSPRKDDTRYTLSKDYIRPTQTGIRQNANEQPSTSSQQSNSSLSDSSQRTSETGQSEHHSFETKTIKRKPLEDKGDDESDDEKEGRDEVFEQVSEHHHSKRDNTQVQTILTEREHVMETEFYVPDIEASQAEMDALKEEHEKTMEAIRKAASERKQRTDSLKNKTKKVIETEFEMTKELETLNDEDLQKRNNENKQVTFDMNSIETREYSILSEDNEPQDVPEKKAVTEYVTETKRDRSETDDTESKLQKLESMWKDYVRIEKELKQRNDGNDDKSKNDLIDDVMSDNDEPSSSKREATPLKSRTEPVTRPNFRDYKVQTNIETDEPLSPITKMDKTDIKFMPTYTIDYKGDRPRSGAETAEPSDRKPAVVTYTPRNVTKTVVKENVTKVTPDRKPAVKESVTKVTSDRKPAAITSIPPVSAEKIPTVRSVDKVPAIVKSDKKPVTSLPRSLSVDTYTNKKGKTCSIGTEVSVDISDDFTQTDNEIVPSYEPPQRSQKKDSNSNQIKSELDRLHKERVEIIEMLALNYLPASLTVELLEAKLNYCIGQTDLLLGSLEETWNNIQDVIEIEEEHNTHVVTKEYLTKYMEDLRKSKYDIKVCKERMDIKSGKGRGRPVGRKRDLHRMMRQTEIEAFQAERKMEQQNFNTVKSINRISPAFDEIDRKFNSASPRNRDRINIHTMSPSEHAAYLIKLRKQVVKATEQEDVRHRISRSCSPYVGQRYDGDHTPLASPRSYSAYSSETLTSSPHISISVTEPVENGIGSYTTSQRRYSTDTYSSTSQRSYSADANYYSSLRQQTYTTDSPSRRSGSMTYTTDSPSRRSGSYSRTPPQYNRFSSPDYSRSMSPQYNRSSSPHLNRSVSPQYNLRTDVISPHHSYELSPQYNLRTDVISPHHSYEQEALSESVYSVNETQELLREIQEARERNQVEISRAEETLNSHRNGTSSSTYNRPYSSYTNSACDSLNTTNLSGSYELYDERSNITMSRSSSCRSLDSDSVHGNYLSPRYEQEVMHTRPISSSDIKTRILRHRRLPRT